MAHVLHELASRNLDHEIKELRQVVAASSRDERASEAPSLAPSVPDEEGAAEGRAESHGEGAKESVGTDVSEASEARGSGTDDDDDDDDDFIIGPLHDAIEAERARLMEADSVLACLYVALDPMAEDALKGPYFPDVVKIARKLLRKSIDQLDSVELRPLIEAETKRRASAR